jgi:glycosyltransferase involved in cell wall biosynthesis
MSFAADGSFSRARPTVSIGLPVYNGERYLAQAIDALLAQTFEDFELIISDNASDDRTEEICRAYAQRDTRVRYIRQPVNLGADPNHSFVVEQARGRFFKWAGHDDLYEPEFLRLCVEALESHPDVVLAHAGDGIIDESGEVLELSDYRVDTANPQPAARLRSLLYIPGGNDDYGVMYTDRIRSLPPYGTGGYGSDRVFTAAMALQGRFYHVPQTLYFRRDHPARVSRASRRDRAVVNDSRRANRRWNAMPRLHVEYVLGYLDAVRRAPLSRAERWRCWLEVAGWALHRAVTASARRSRARELQGAS